MATTFGQFLESKNQKKIGENATKLPSSAAPASVGPVPDAGIVDRVADASIDLGQGIIAGGEALIGLMDIPTAGLYGKAYQKIGLDTAMMRGFLNDYYSPERQQENAAVSKAFDEQGFFPGIGEAISEPATVAGAIIQSVPTMVAGGAIGGAIGAAVPKLAPLAGALGEGIIGAGAAAEGIRQSSDDGLLSAKQLAAIGLTGVATTGFSLLGSKIAGKLGLEDFDNLVAGQKMTREQLAAGAKKSIPRKTIEGAISEGLLEELPQSVSEQILQNLALDKDWNEGINEAAGMGLLSGAAMGAGVNARSQATLKVLETVQKRIDEAHKGIDKERELDAATGAIPTSLINDGEMPESVAAAQTAERRKEAVDQNAEQRTAELKHKAELERISEKILTGVDLTPEEAAYQSQDPEAFAQVHAATHAQQTEKRSSELRKTTDAVAASLGQDPGMFMRVAIAVRQSTTNIKDFTKRMVEMFGEQIKGAIGRLYNAVVKSNLLTDETGAVGLDISEVKANNPKTRKKFLKTAAEELKAGTTNAETLVQLRKMHAAAEGKEKELISSIGKAYAKSLQSNTEQNQITSKDPYESLVDDPHRKELDARRKIPQHMNIEFSQLLEAFAKDPIWKQTKDEKYRKSMEKKAIRLRELQAELGISDQETAQAFTKTKEALLRKGFRPTGAALDSAVKKVKAFDGQHIERDTRTEDEQLSEYAKSLELQMKDAYREDEEIVSADNVTPNDYLLEHEDDFSTVRKARTHRDDIEEKRSSEKENFGIHHVTAKELFDAEAEFGPAEKRFKDIRKLDIVMAMAVDKDAAEKEFIKKNNKVLVTAKEDLAQNKALQKSAYDPSRGRPVSIAEYIGTLLDLISDTNDIETLVRIILHENNIKSLKDLRSFPETLYDFLEYNNQDQEVEESINEEYEQENDSAFSEVLKELEIAMTGPEQPINIDVAESVEDATRVSKEKIKEIKTARVKLSEQEIAQAKAKREERQKTEKEFSDRQFEAAKKQDDFKRDVSKLPIVRAFISVLRDNAALGMKRYSSARLSVEAIVVRMSHKLKSQFDQVSGDMVVFRPTGQRFKKTDTEGMRAASAAYKNEFDAYPQKGKDGKFYVSMVDGSFETIEQAQAALESRQKKIVTYLLNNARIRYGTFETKKESDYFLGENQDTSQYPVSETGDDLFDDVRSNREPFGKENYGTDSIAIMNEIGRTFYDIRTINKKTGEIEYHSSVSYSEIKTLQAKGLEVERLSKHNLGNDFVWVQTKDANGRWIDPQLIPLSEYKRTLEQGNTGTMRRVVKLKSNGETQFVTTSVAIAMQSKDKNTVVVWTKPATAVAAFDNTNTIEIIIEMAKTIKNFMNPSEMAVPQKHVEWIENKLSEYAQRNQELLESLSRKNKGLTDLTREYVNNERNEINKKINELVDYLKSMLYANQLAAETAINTKSFEELANKLDNGLSASELYAAYCRDGGSPIAFLARIEELEEKKKFREADKLYKAVIEDRLEELDITTPEEFKTYLLLLQSSVSEGNEESYSKSVSQANKIEKQIKFRKRLQTMLLGKVKGGIKAYNDYRANGDNGRFDSEQLAVFRFVDGIVSSLLLESDIESQMDTDYENANRQAVMRFMQKTSVATERSKSGLPIESHHMITERLPRTLTAFEQELQSANPNMIIGKLQSPIARRFYSLVAKVFGADLVIVSDSAYRSRYIGEASDGRSKIIVNMNGDKPFAGVFGHELMHHVVNKANPAAYTAFKDALVDRTGKERFDNAIEQFMEQHPNLSRASSEEEVIAEIFSSVYTSKEFYNRLAQSMAGKTLAQKLLLRLFDLGSKINVIFNEMFAKTVRVGKEGPGFHIPLVYEAGLPLDVDLINLFADFIGRTAEENNDIRSAGVKFYTVFGQMTKDEINGYLGKSTGWLKGVWQDIFPKGIKSHRDLMDGIAKMLHIFTQAVKEYKGSLWFADFLNDHVHTALMNKIAFNPHSEAKLIYARVLKKHKATFEGKSDADKMMIHDFFARGLVVETYLDENNVERYKVQKFSEEPFNEDGSENEKFWKVAERMFGKEVANAYRDYKKLSDQMFAMLQSVTDVDYNARHFGQSIRWYREGQAEYDDTFDWILDPEASVLKGNTSYLKERSDKALIQLLEKGLKFRTIDPNELMLQYVTEAYKLITLKQVFEEGMRVKDTEGKNPLKIFSSDVEAAAEGYVPIQDTGLKIMSMLKIETEDGSEVPPKGVLAFAVVHTATNTEVKRFESKQAAERFSSYINAKSPGDVHVEEVKVPIESAQVGQIYLRPDMARMMKVYLGKNHLLKWKPFNTLMKIKNSMTAFEFAFSLFHALTIGNELISSYTAWAWVHRKQGKFNPKSVLYSLGDSKELILLMEAAAENYSLAQEPAFKKRVEELLGMQGVDVLELIRDYALVGGQLHQDKSLRGMTYDFGEMKYRTEERRVIIDANGKLVITGKRGFIEGTKDAANAVRQSMQKAFDKELENHPDQKLKAWAKTALFGALQGPSAWLMEELIPQVKMAMFMREFTTRLEREAADIKSGVTSREAIAHNTMKFVEDRFGEVNWQNQWMDPSIKTLLQFSFRSFTWFTGSWKALTKAGVDISKVGWFFIHDLGLPVDQKTNYKMTEKGRWGIAVLFTHIATAMMIKTLYTAAAMAAGGDVPDDEDTPLLTDLLFPRVDLGDPSARVTIPSYVTEGYKIMRHTGMIGNERELHKLVSGRFSSIIGRFIEVMAGEDWRGVKISDPQDNIAQRAFDTLWHIFGVAPISISSASKSIGQKGMNAKALLAFTGMTDAPAAAKRSDATNLAYHIRRSEHKGASVSEDVMEQKDEIKKAFYKYQRGDKSEVKALLKEGKLSRRQYQNALKKLPMINGKKNPLYEDDLTRALRGITIDGAIEVWKVMTDREKKLHKRAILEKYRNMMRRNDRSRVEKTKIAEQLKDAGILARRKE